MGDLKGKTLYITGASRGIGLAIALRAARDGANIAIAAKSGEPHPKLPGTIYTAAEEIEKVGGRSLPMIVDVRDENQVSHSIERTVEQFGGIDICVNNASAIQLSDTASTQMKRFDLMHQVNTRGTFMVSKYCLSHLMKSSNPHILMIAPPVDMNPKWFSGHVAYALAKFGMSLCVLGMADEFKKFGIAVNALWPRTTIATAAIKYIVGGDEMMQSSRKPDIMADAAHVIFLNSARKFTGQFCIDEALLAENGETDFDKYRMDPNVDLTPDYFIPEDYTSDIPLRAVDAD